MPIITRRPLLASLLFVPLMLSMPTQAQTPSPEPQAQNSQSQTQPPNNRNGEVRDRLMAADANKDNQWSREEWRAAGRRDRGFDMIDADSNGQITREELRTGMERMQTMRRTRQD